MPPGFKRTELRARYDVPTIHEDEWHTYSGERTQQIIGGYLSLSSADSHWLLNAGAGTYEIGAGGWKEVAVDLFIAPLQKQQHAVCASIEALPFGAGLFGAIVCVGEVLAYCDPAAAIAEFARVLAPGGVLICDFGNSSSVRYWFRESHGRAADLVTDQYNGTPERTWIYDPAYVISLLHSAGLTIRARLGTHTWSAVARRMGAGIKAALFLQKRLAWVNLPSAWADLTTIVATRAAVAK